MSTNEQPANAVPSPSQQPSPTLWPTPDFSVTPAGTPGVKNIIRYGQILHKPVHRPHGVTGDISYELGLCAQLDDSHAIIIVNIDEQGGGDLCVGTDAFVFQKIEDIQPENAIPITRVDPNYVLKSGKQGYLAKFPGPVGFVPLGAKRADGTPHPAAGTGFFIGASVAKEGKQAAEGVPETPHEIVQLRWDGEKLTVSPGVLFDHLLGIELTGGSALSHPTPVGDSMLMPAVVGDKICVFQFDYNGSEWAATKHGTPFHTAPGRPGEPGEEFKICSMEFEPSMQRHGDEFLLYTRGNDCIGRLYRSHDGFEYELVSERDNLSVPQVLNQGLDGGYYVVSNPGPGMLRNPLQAWPWDGQKWGEPITIHDQDGIRTDDGDKIPFVDHCFGANLFLEGRWRHIVSFRVCDLKERTLHAFMIAGGEDKRIFGDEGPLDQKLSTSGLYLAELVY